jgi:starch synthase (maltosyl-transferring)
VLVVVTLNPYSVQDGTTSLDMPALGLDWNDRMVVHDEMGGGTRDYEWGQFNFVRLDPHVEPAHVFVVRR